MVFTNFKPERDLNEPLKKRRQVLGKRSFMYRYPRTFTTLGTMACLSVFFSKPLYDIFFAPSYKIDLSEPDPRFRE